MREWGFTVADRERTNVHGSGISLGHPSAPPADGCSPRCRELHRRDARYGLETMCIGGGQGLGGGIRAGGLMLARTLCLTEVQTEIIETVRRFVDKEIIPHAQWELEHADEYPQAIVDQMGDGPVRPDDPHRIRRAGESLTYALCVEELARGWMSISGVINTRTSSSPT